MLKIANVCTALLGFFWPWLSWPTLYKVNQTLILQSYSYTFKHNYHTFSNLIITHSNMIFRVWLYYCITTVNRICPLQSESSPVLSTTLKVRHVFCCLIVKPWHKCLAKYRKRNNSLKFNCYAIKLYSIIQSFLLSFFFRALARALKRMFLETKSGVKGTNLSCKEKQHIHFKYSLM